MFFVCGGEKACAQITELEVDGEISDSLFLSNSRSVIFPVNRTEISAEYRRYLMREVVPDLKMLSNHGVVLGRAAASPEGSYENNHRLAVGRLNSLTTFFESVGLETSHIRFDTLVEDYPMLAEMMRRSNDPDYPVVKDFLHRANGDAVFTKKLLQQEQNGKLWARLNRDYFPDLRAVRILIVWDHQYDFSLPLTIPFGRPDLTPHYNIDGDLSVRPVSFSEPVSKDRRELLSVKTNMLAYGVYIPQYKWAPIPNVDIEYYPKHGHWTYGAKFDCPWWVGNTSNHKYFEVRDYIVETKRYFRNSDEWYDEGGAAFKKLYVEAYANAAIYQIGFNKDKGWIGEGLGGGLGVGYVLPISKDERWRLDFHALFGGFVTKYDPFVYGCPVEKFENGLYYYDYTGDPNLFKKRQYRFTWMGPTRIGISLSYDLLYRKNGRKGISFRRTEKGVDR